MYVNVKNVSFLSIFFFYYYSIAELSNCTHTHSQILLYNVCSVLKDKMEQTTANGEIKRYCSMNDYRDFFIAHNFWREISQTLNKDLLHMQMEYKAALLAHVLKRETKTFQSVVHIMLICVSSKFVFVSYLMLWACDWVSGSLGEILIRQLHLTNITAQTLAPQMGHLGKKNSSGRK